MNEQDQIKALAELDGWTDYLFGSANDCVKHKGCDWKIAPRYLTSYDAIIPLIQKQPYEVLKRMDEHYELVSFAYEIPSVAQLCEALLRATGKWKDNEQHT